MAIYQARTGKIIDGKGVEATAWMHKVVGYINATYPECNYEVLSNIGGELNQLHAVSRFESLAQYENFQAKLMTDEQYRSIVREMWDAQLMTGWSDRLYQVRTPN